MNPKRKKLASISAGLLCCCVASFALCSRYVAKHPSNDPPPWFGPVCGITAIIGIVSIAVLVVALAFGRNPRKDGGE
jgi:hypothetical protein